ncbi:hypothetical protein [Halarcobacter ebronensis]|uniref:Uncharacterized protein n=1 Tax=Halarcobacter ebronensis TaxID=1462615 RepID=A0A4Q1AHR9_9BACT|nr:hypothetical protein [Halarcobacter ebronensis]QKF82226.1 hypothetical protein AEBR_1744 [Halarcobacter ebronensis]RXK03398.1 hypothetical protein CRV07_12000 [Halarcobacter ebronensis]
MENELYDLADFLDDIEIKSLKDRYTILLENRDKIKFFLDTNFSLKQQINEIKKEFELEISVFSYRNFLIKYFQKSYEEHTINKVFLNCKVSILDLVLNKKYNDSIELYKYLLSSGVLKKVKNDDNSVITYKQFIQKLKEYITVKHLPIKIVEEIEEDKIKEEIKENTPIETNTKERKEINYDMRVDIELLDGTLDPYNLGFLTYSYIFKKHSKKKYDFDEKNYIVIPSSYQNLTFDFEKIKNFIFEKDLVKNYSLVFHDNKLNDGFIYIYRLINSKFHLLEKIASRESSDFEEYYKNGIRNYLNIFNDILDSCIKN